MKKLESNDYYVLMFQSYPDIVDVKQVQTMLGIGRQLVYTLITSGEIHALKIGKTYKIPKVNVIRYVLSQHIEESTAS